MMNRLVSWSNITGSSRVKLAMLLLGAQVGLPGCGIPTLRSPEAGAPLPARFEDANNLQQFQDSPARGMPQYSLKTSHSGKFRREEVVEKVSQPPQWMNSFPEAGSISGTASLVSFTEPDAVFGQGAGANLGIQPASFQEVAEPTPASEGQGTADAESKPAALIDLPEPEALPAPGTVGDGPSPVNQPPGELSLQNGTDDWGNTSFVPLHVFFNDPILTGLIDQAFAGNQELKILTQEVQIASLEVQARSGDYLPFVNFGAGAGIDKPGQYTRAGAVEDQLQVRPGKAFPEPLPNFLMAANVSWEIDIWRKLRNARDAATMRYFATRDGQNYIVTRLVAEVAENYYALLALDNRLMALDQTIAIQEQSLRLAEAKKEAARGTELAVQRFQAEVRKNQSEKLIVRQEIVETENRINFLLGRYPQQVQRMSDQFLDLNLRALSSGVPSELLMNRADIREAEREIEATGLDVQVARARFYPSLALSAGIGYEAFNPRYLLTTPESLIYNVAGDLVAPLINKRAIKADYLTANAKQLQAVYKYQQTVLNAFTEVINRMAKVENYGQSIEIKKQQLAALEASVDSATKLFQNARAEYVEVLLAQRDLMEARMVLIDTKKEQLSAVVSAYQALGGGGVQLQP